MRFKTLLTLLLFSLALATSAAAQTFVVTKASDTNDGACNSDCSLREAVNALNVAAFLGGNFTVEIPMGTYRLSIPGVQENNGATGDLDLANVRATILIQGAGRDSTILDGGELDRVLEIFAPDADVTLSDLTIRRGRTNHAGGGGGGLLSDTSLTLRRVTLEDNGTTTTGADGGALLVNGSALLEDCTIRDSFSDVGFGGGIFNAGSLEIRRSTIAGNRAGQGFFGGGGGIANLGELRVEQSTISGNTAGSTARSGGGIFAQGRIELVNSTVSGNQATAGQGGGIFSNSAGLLHHVTLANNSAAAGGAIFLEGTPDMRLSNSIVSGGCAGAPNSDGGNLESPGSSCGLGTDDLANVSAADLALGGLADNGGPTETHALPAASAAIDDVVTASCLATDQRGEERPRDGDGDGSNGCDAGAYERGGGNGNDPEGDCVEDGETLCLNGDRFQVTSTWRTPAGETGSGQAIELTADTGYFWFFSPDNVEAVVKLLDGCGINDRFWVFTGGLTDVEVEMTILDTESGERQVYRNPLGTPFQPIQDTSAFATCP